MTDEYYAEFYGRIDRMLRARDFTSVDGELSLVDVEKLEITQLLAWLTITLAASHELTMRRGYYERVKARLERIDPKRVTALLAGLERP